MSELNAVPQVDTIYTVVAGDSLSKLAQKFYNDASKYPLIASRNNMDPKSILFIGAKLVIPALTVPEVEVPAPYVQTDDGVITVTSTAKRIPAAPSRSKWWTDLRIWVGVAVLVGGVWYISRRSK